MKRLNVLVLGAIASITVVVALAGLFVDRPADTGGSANRPQSGLDIPF